MPGRAPAQGDPTGPAATLLDRAVAVVGDRVITASEVELAVALARVDPAGIPLLGPDPQDPEGWWMQQVMLRELAGDIAVYQPGGAEVRERVERLLEALADAPAGPRGLLLPDLQQRLGMRRPTLEAWVYNRLVVERFVQRNATAIARGGEEAVLSPERYAQWLEVARQGVAIRSIGPVSAPSPGSDPLPESVPP